jgi:hypothetical protein
VILTNGNIWKIIKLGKNGEYQETGFYEGNSDDHKKIYLDFEMQKIVLGMIKYSLQGINFIKTLMQMNKN